MNTSKEQIWWKVCCVSATLAGIAFISVVGYHVGRQAASHPYVLQLCQEENPTQCAPTALPLHSKEECAEVINAAAWAAGASWVLGNQTQNRTQPPGIAHFTLSCLPGKPIQSKDPNAGQRQISL